jgi:XTP/dITP diphosphohydrolase
VSPRRFSDKTLVIASHNPGKLSEISDLLSPFGINIVSAAEQGLPEPEETGANFVENAIIKAQSAAMGANLPALADDSGLVVPALGGKPGLHSARWAGPEKDFAKAMEKIKDALKKAGEGLPQAAHFVCALVLCWPDGHVECFEGHVYGQLIWPPKGHQGFGYDPMFIADGLTITFGEMDPAAKHAISHRADAFRQLVAACFA